MNNPPTSSPPLEDAFLDSPPRNPAPPEPREPPDLVFRDAHGAVTDKDMIMFEGVEQIDGDIDFGFRLRGHSLNPLLDAATPLFGLVIRARRMTDHSQIPPLYVRVRDEISVILEAIKQAGYDGSTQLAYSYCLCAFVDEAIMATPWGAYSVWAERSMLSIYHDETWGGEKFFTILSRMLLEPEQYEDMLVLGYYCLGLGFRGKYGLQFDGAVQLQTIMRKLHDTLGALKDAPEDAPDSLHQVEPTPYGYKPDAPLWRYWLVSGAIILLGYGLYQHKLNGLTRQILEQLASLLPG